MKIAPIKRLELTRGIKIAAIYLIVVGGLGFIWPLIGLVAPHQEFTDQSFAGKLGSSAREIIMSLLFIISGIGIFYKKLWARKLALVILVVSAIYSGNSFAWGFSGGKPHPMLLLISVFVVGVWNGIWFYLIYKNKPLIIREKDGNAVA